VHSDVRGPISEPSRGGALHFNTFTDDFSRWTDVFFLHMKSDLLAEYKKWLTKAQLHTGNKIKVLRSDNDGEYVSTAFTALHDENGTSHQTTVPDTPQQNGVAERLNRVLVEMARTVMRHKDVEQDLLADAIKTAVYTWNRGTSRALPVVKTPHELWTGNKPDKATCGWLGRHAGWCCTRVTSKAGLETRPRRAFSSSAVLPSRFFGYFQATWGRHSVVPHRKCSLRLGMAGRGSGDTIIRFGWHVQRLRQRESSSHGQVPG